MTTITANNKLQKLANKHVEDLLRKYFEKEVNTNNKSRLVRTLKNIINKKILSIRQDGISFYFNWELTNVTVQCIIYGKDHGVAKFKKSYLIDLAYASLEAIAES